VPAPARLPALASASAPTALVASAASTAAASNAADLQSDLGGLLRTEDAALRELTLLWKLNLDGFVNSTLSATGAAGAAGATGSVSAGDACAATQRSQVHCLRGKSTLALIRQMNRPGVLTLFDAKGQPHYALLTALTAQTATLRAAGVSRTVTLWALAAVWRGDFVTLWQAPTDYRGALQRGSTGSGVRQLASQLAALQGQAPPAAPPSGTFVFDAALKAKVDAFQISQGLVPDGVMGPTTFMQLNRAQGVDEPRLFEEAPRPVPVPVAVPPPPPLVPSSALTVAPGPAPTPLSAAPKAAAPAPK